MKKFFVLLIALLILTGCGDGSIYSSGEGENLRRDMEFRGVFVITDKTTGCQYIGGINSGITPRLDKDKNQVGCR